MYLDEVMAAQKRGEARGIVFIYSAHPWVLVRDYVEVGFVKIHLDCSMRLRDDPQGALDVAVSAERTARLARVSEDSLCREATLQHHPPESSVLVHVIGWVCPFLAVQNTITI